jgi:hypothetical protein
MDASVPGRGSDAANVHIAETNEEIGKVQLQIEAVEKYIQQCNEDIRQCEEAISTATTSEEKHQLREKEHQLREEKRQLREKERQLREEKRLLREEKLRQNPAILSPQEDADRLIGIDYRIEDQKLKHSFDLHRFMSRVDQLFEWWEKTGANGYQKYLAPYFPCIQSSGMGKTKLLREAHRTFTGMTGAEKNNEKKRSRDDDDDDKHNVQKVASALILCRTDSSTSLHVPAIYMNVLLVPKDLSNTTRSHICDQLNGFLDAILKKEPTESHGKRKIVLFVDEAQHLLTNDAFGFRCVRWWLRRNDRPLAQVVAVFAGTSSGLANFYRDIPAVTQNSRDSESTYIESGPKLFEPFFDLCTMGLFVKRTQPQLVPADKNDAKESDYDRAVPYGRPLFALLKQQDDLTTEREGVILRRMTLSEPNWFENEQACLSVLGTRVQMGQTSFSIASHLVKNGYANLTYFYGPAQIAQIAYMPDPVCARLAMCVMDPKWKMPHGELQGREKKKWSEKMGSIVSTGLCRPHKGDLGEIASALYLLFCGDMLRATSNTSDAGDGYRTFQVPLLKFLQVAFDPEKCSSSADASTANVANASVSFIQVCRSHARPSFSEMFSLSSLEWLYHAACACYCYEGCPAIDWYAPIRCCFEDGKPLFIPLVVSVKARRTMSTPEMVAALTAMRVVVEEGPQNVGVCVLFLIGLNKPESIESGFYDDKGNKINTPNNLDMRWTWNVLVSVPSDDTFGLSDVVTQTTLDGDAKAEVYTSHGFLHAYLRENDTSGCHSLLRTKAKNDETVYLKGLCEAFGQIDVDA